jgi:putative intracellular protease/amidase
VRTVGTLLFPDFELLDVFGPLEIFGTLRDDYRLALVAERSGPVASRQGPQAVAETSLADAPDFDVLLIPGGRGTRREVDNKPLVDWIRAKAELTPTIATVCTGAALLARTGLLDGRKATSNKASFGWVMSQGPNVDWQPRARWVVDGNFFTSSGVSAGIDMALALVSALDGREKAQTAAAFAEYRWNEDSGDDPFADLYDLTRR